VEHCQFNLADVRRVLSGSKLRPTPYSWLALQALPLSEELKEAAKTAVKTKRMIRLNRVLTQLGKMRNQIATVTPPPT
jgi:ribosomal 50S subunit-associated protein YjgA (DUF615 family)